MSHAASDERFFDAARLREHARALRALAEAPEPNARLVSGTAPPAGGRLGLLAGSFNPPTLAHVTLAEVGLASGRLDRVAWVLSTRTVDKEVVSGAALEDRLLLLDLLGEADPRLGTLVVNRGLYVDQATIARAAFPSLGALVFLVGFDKVVQIFDPRYYDDRDADLERLFGLATFLVAPRGADDADALAALLRRPENGRFAGAVEPLNLPPALRDVASSQVRQAVRGGTDVEHAVPTVVRAFTEVAGVYADDGRYRGRLALLASLDGRDGDLDAMRERLRAAARR
jgi:nicotinic acid mononucleotide adenylyltransferase